MDWNYITGFFDADGSITLTCPNKGKNKTLQLSFHNNELEILKSIQKFILDDLGIKGFISKKLPKKDNHNIAYDLKYNYISALKVANKISSLHPKKSHRIKIYNLIQTKIKRNGKYSNEEILEREILEKKFFQI